VRIIALLLFFSFLSCQEAFIQDDRLVPYAEMVQQELHYRGIAIDLDVNLILKPNLTYKGEKGFGLSDGDNLFVNEEIYYWMIEHQYYVKLEGLLAHELGHNKLNLDHFDRTKKAMYYEKPIIMISGEWQRIHPDNRKEMYDVMVQLIKSDYPISSH
jgi:hypothetical protein